MYAKYPGCTIPYWIRLHRSEVFAVMNDLPQHVFQILTKRPSLRAALNGRANGLKTSGKARRIFFIRKSLMTTSQKSSR